MKDKLRKFINDRNLVFLTAALTVLVAINIYFYIDSGYLIEPLLRIILFSIAIPFLVFIGNPSLPYLMAGIALVLAQTITFTNYTPYILIYIALTMKEKWKWPLLTLYGIDIVIVCMRHSKSPLHLIAHFGICIIIYFLLGVQVSSVRKQKPLDLTPDEEYVVSELAKGKLQKEVEGYSENTVSKKLKNCRKKNGCVNNEELIALYRQSIKSNI